MIWLAIVAAFVWVAPPMLDLYTDLHTRKKPLRSITTDRVNAK